MNLRTSFAGNRSRRQTEQTCETRQANKDAVQRTWTKIIHPEEKNIHFIKICSLKLLAISPLLVPLISAKNIDALIKWQWRPTWHHPVDNHPEVIPKHRVATMVDVIKLDLWMSKKVKTWCPQSKVKKWWPRNQKYMKKKCLENQGIPRVLPWGQPIRGAKVYHKKQTADKTKDTSDLKHSFVYVKL